MDTPPMLSPLAPRHFRFHHRSPSPSPTRQRVSDDLLSDLSPATTLEAFTTPSGKLWASVEAASPAERAFGIRATLASKKIQEWLDELSTWPWPTESGSAGFETPVAKRRKVSITPLTAARNGRHGPREEDDEKYVGSLLAQDVIRYETRVEEIHEDMDEMDVEEIKTKVLDTFSAKSRPSSPRPNQPMPSLFSSYTRMDDFTAVVTATVLRALPNLSRLMRLMDVWSIRLTVLRKVPPLLHALDDAEIALKSGWNTVQMFDYSDDGSGLDEKKVLTRPMFEVMRDVLQDKVTLLGQELDFMLDTLEGREDTLPDSWLDRMEVIEQEYGNWVVSGDRKVREGEWARSANARKMAEDERRARAEEAAAAQKQSEEKKARKASEPDLVEQQIAQEQSQADVDTTADGHNQEEALNARELATTQSQQNSNSSVLHADAVNLVDADAKESDSGTDAASVRQDIVTLAEDDSPEVSANQERSNESTASKIIPAVFGAVAGTIAAATGILGKDSDDDDTVDSGANSESGASPVFEAPKSEETSNVQVQRSTPAADPHQITTEDSTVVPPFIPAESSKEAAITSKSGSNSAAREIGRRHSATNASIQTSPSKRPMNSRNGRHRAGSGSHVSLSEAPRFGHGLANTIRRSLSQQSSYEQDSSSSPRAVPRKSSMIYDQENLPRHMESSVNHLSTPVKEIVPSPIFNSQNIIKEAPEPALEDSQSTYAAAESDDRPESVNVNTPIVGPTTPKPHRGSTSSMTVPRYESSPPTPQIHEAEPSDYFQPFVSHVRSPSQESGITDMDASYAMTGSDEVLPSIETPDFLDQYVLPLRSVNEDSNTRSGQFDGAFASQPGSRKKSEHVLEDFTPEFDATSVVSTSSSTGNLVQNSEDSRPDSIVSDSSTVLTGQQMSAMGSPEKESFDDTVASTPASDSENPQSFPEIDISSPSAGRVGHRNRFYDRSPSGTPEPAIRTSRHLFDSPAFTPSPEPDSQASEPPLLDVEISTPSALSSPTKSHSTDDHMQQQISSLLESLPAKIRLTSEPGTTPPATYSVRSKKSRSTLTPNYTRSHSSMSTSRSPTPFLTLAPAYAKNPRPRTNNGNPDIKLYHLSRSTGEAPIKLFVRLVGENGERVMVRVGGGWADLGEYLKEYASHHGRRSGSGIDPDNLGKVEIQDLPPRMVTSGSIASMRGGRDSPAPRPASAMERAPSSTNLRKTRKSLGVADEISASLASLRSPSTPVQTPADRSSSRLGWTEDEGASLGLAGPNSKRKEQDLSAENVIWVESMKEKVRQASAEKEKKARERERKEKFGEMDKIGGTKRLFPKG